MRNSDSGGIEPHRRVIQLALERDFAVDPEQISVRECRWGDCECQFIGADLEDYAVHLVTDHRVFAISQKKLYHAIYRKIKDAKQRGEIDEI